jgi:hypothetical protein
LVGSMVEGVPIPILRVALGRQWVTYPGGSSEVRR